MQNETLLTVGRIELAPFSLVDLPVASVRERSRLTLLCLQTDLLKLSKLKGGGQHTRLKRNSLIQSHCQGLFELIENL